ncbi:MAG: hypothetical protein Q9170_003257 [Blastenia crenularia]
MPMMMDDELDDLFADEQLGPAAAVPGLSSIPKGLIQSTDDSRISGCSQKVAWSNQGCIGNISGDGHSLTLRNLYCDPATGLWRLSEGGEAKNITLIHDGHALKHLSWSHSGTELAVTDALGNISVFSLHITIDRCIVSRRCVLGAEDDLSTIVGLMWLNQDRSSPLHRPAVKAHNGQWVFGGSRFRHPGPHNPHLAGDQPGKNKSAIVTITRAGVIRLIYQGPDGARWLDFRSELNTVSAAAELLTHAAVSADKDSSLLVTTHSISERLRIYRVGINWQRQGFDIDHVAMVADSSPSSKDVDDSRLASGLPYPEAQLYRLEMVSPGPDLRSKETLAPLLLAFFSNSSDPIDQLTAGHDPTTSIVRWEMSSSKPTLHTGFSQLASKRSGPSNPVDLQPEVIFRKLPCVSINRVIVASHQLNLGTVLVFCLSDGSVEFRDRTTLEPLLHDDTPARASSVVQVGLGFTGGIPYTVEAVAEAFVLQFSISCSGYGNYHDDISATMQLFQDQYLSGDVASQALRFINPFLSDVHRVSQLNIDFSGDIKTEQYLKNGLHQRTLSMQVSLGYWGDTSHRSLSSKVAFAILQLRWAALTFAMGLKPNPSGTPLSGEAEFKRTETVRSFFGIISWTLSLMNFVADEVFALATATEYEPAVMDMSSKEDVVEAKVSELNTPALALLFVSQSRLLFKYIFRFFRGITVEITQQRSQDPTWRELGSMFSRSPMPLHQFERLLAEIDTSIRHIYQSEPVSEADRKEIEKSMLITGAVSPRLWLAVESLLTTTVRNLREEVNVAELYFHDVSWLGLSDDKASDQWRKAHRLDIIRKVELPKTSRVRQCTRCCSVMEDTAPPRGTAAWLVNMWRTCVCGNWWMSVKEECQVKNVVS